MDPTSEMSVLETGQLDALSGLLNRSNKEPSDALKKAARDFEAVFIAYMLKTMRRSVPNSSLFGKGISGEFYTSLFDEKIAGAVASKGSFGLADKIMESLAPSRSADSDLHALRIDTASAYASDWDRSLISRTARRYDLDPKLVEAVIQVESSFRPHAVSPKGAVGLMQLMAGTATELGIQDRRHPQQNIEGGCQYLRRLLDRFDGELELALAAYNAGPTAVEGHGGIPPFPETRRYVERVMQIYERR